MEQQRWHILQRDGTATPVDELPERPDDANPSNGEDFRPWYKQDEHLHIENGSIAGIHAMGTLKEVQARLRSYVNNEAAILEKFGGGEDQLLPDIDAFLDGRK